jgi:hypothetical protein
MAVIVVEGVLWGGELGERKYSKVLSTNLAVSDPEYKIVHKKK